MIEALSKGQPGISSENWEFVEWEHRPFDAGAIRKEIHQQLANKTAGKATLAPIVRIPPEGDELIANRWMIKQTLESGAMGIVVPKVETAEEARKLVEAMRYPQLRGSKYPEPAGLRGGGGPGREWGLQNPRDYAAVADLWPLNPAGELVALPMVETVRTVENVPAILDVPGVTGVFVGPSDFSLSHGVTDPEHPDVQASIKRVAAACVEKKKYCAIQVTKPDAEARYLKMGFKIILRRYSGSK